MFVYDGRSEGDRESPTRRPLNQKQLWKPKAHEIIPGRLGAGDDKKHRIPLPQTVIRHESVNYLELRRTESSKRALLRNREITREVLAPSSPTKVENPPSNLVIIKERIAKLAASGFQMLSEPMQPVVYAPVADALSQEIIVSTQEHNALIKKDLIYLQQEKARAQRACKEETDKILTALDGVRADISNMYMFTPSFRIWTRTKTKSALERWQWFVQWHRAETERLFQLTHYALPIQRAFRMRRQRNHGRIDRIELRRAQWIAAVMVQTWFRGIIAQRETQRLRESRVAISLQSAWRGRVGRKRVRQILRDQIRRLLRHLSPTGSLHRLEFIYHGEMRVLLERFISLAVDVQVSFDPATIVQQVIAPTIRGLHQAVHELKELVNARATEIRQVKYHYQLQRNIRQSKQRQQELHEKTMALDEAIQKHHQALNTMLMFKEDCEAKELMRMELKYEANTAYRKALQEQRREKEACLAMHMEEMQMNHFLAEERWRLADLQRRLLEVNKVEKWKKAQEDEAIERLNQHVLQLLEKQQIARAIAEKEKHERFLSWRIKTQEDYQSLHERLQEREKARIEQKMQRKLHKLQRKQEQMLRVQALEISRAQKHTELEREFAERMAMDAEELATRRYLSDQKKLDESVLWCALREEMNKAMPDPLALEPSAMPQLQELESERRAKLEMALEEARMKQFLKEEAKMMYLRQARQRAHEKERELKREAKELQLMQAEEDMEQAWLAKLRKAEEYYRTLEIMKAADAAYNLKQAERLFEARCRKLMHDEEMRIHRFYTEVLHRERLRERKERHIMHNEDLYMHHILEEREKLRLRTLEKTCRVELSVEDVRAHQVRELEREGMKIGLAIWLPLEDKALQSYVVAYPTLLRWNIEFMIKVTGVQGDPPWKGVNWAPRAYTVFSSAPNKPVEVPPEVEPVELTRAQQLWSRLRYQYLKKTQAKRVAYQGYAELNAGELEKAQRTLRIAFRNGYKSAQLVRAIGKCYVKLYERHFRDADIRMGRVWYTKASQRIELSISPYFLVEYAQSLYLSGALQHAAEVLATVIKAFPTFEQLPQVIFRAAMLMFALEMYDQSKDYLLYLLESPPIPWTDAELMFIIARLYFLDDDTSHAIFAYDDAYRRWKLQWTGSGRKLHYGSYKAWLADADVWRVFAAKALYHREFILARDLYQQTIKRRHDEVGNTPGRNFDWFHLAQCHTGLCDRQSASIAVKHWLENHPYMDNLLFRCQNWSAATWRTIGLELLPPFQTLTLSPSEDPSAILEPLVVKKTHKRLKQIKSRQKKIRKRKQKPRRTTAELREWTAIYDPNTKKTLYFHEKTYEVTWVRPT